MEMFSGNCCDMVEFLFAAMLEGLRSVISHEAHNKDAISQDGTNAAISFSHRGRPTVAAKSALLRVSDSSLFAALKVASLYF